MFVWHCWPAVSAWAVGVLSITRSLTGTTTAAAMIISRIRRMMLIPQHGSPQQRRFLEAFVPEPSRSVSWYPSGQTESGLLLLLFGVPVRGVATPGGGNDASIPERPERCLSGSGERAAISG